MMHEGAPGSLVHMTCDTAPKALTIAHVYGTPTVMKEVNNTHTSFVVHDICDFR